jgi:hypothetical protein
MTGFEFEIKQITFLMTDLGFKIPITTFNMAGKTFFIAFSKYFIASMLSG